MIFACIAHLQIIFPSMMVSEGKRPSLPLPSISSLSEASPLFIASEYSFRRAWRATISIAGSESVGVGMFSGLPLILLRHTTD